MSFPNVDPFIETFLEPTRIFLFGKQFPALSYDPTVMAPPQAVGPAVGEFESYTSQPVQGLFGGNQLAMPPGRVEQALRKVEDQGLFARIYGFSYEGHYYKLPRPLLFLVRDDGRVAEDPQAAPGAERLYHTRFTGIETKDWQFGNDIRVWAVDKHDIAVCLDLEIGNYEKVLLDSYVAGQEESAGINRSAVSSRSATTFRSAAIGPHQDR